MQLHIKLVSVENQPIKLQRRGFTLAPDGGVPMVMVGKRETRASLRPDLPKANSSHGFS
ncbi:MAG: hypothetical protein RMZ43_034570 [Nostoc sp. CmiVER01]|uniref:hypothetical protein n=1 Tax=Nostoc sp. CmiVER01 TaxID=3075384 RepID=UPI002AD21B7F|nr:hypothetical protein [Nostoc sp. CmiVER01]MDZ8120625.1 hypothetical protein [Nostoc sp. CmiVER01]